MFRLLLVAFLSISWVRCQDEPSISFISPDVSVNIGDTVELVCTTSDASDYPIIWAKLNERSSDDIISTGSTLIIKDSRFSVAKEDDTVTLKIRDAREKDASKYQCQVSLSISDKKTKDVSLFIKTAPKISPDTPQIFQARAGEKLDLACESSGYPHPSINWKRLDGALLHKGLDQTKSGIMSIKSVLIEDGGEYICTSENEVGVDSKTVSLEVGFVPEIKVDRPRIPQALHYDVELKCEIKSNPSPAINWIRVYDNGTEILLKSELNYKVSHFAPDPKTTRSMLKITEIIENQIGDYFCEAANKYGKSKKKIELYKSIIPICPPMCNNQDIESGSVVIFPTFISIIAVSIAINNL